MSCNALNIDKHYLVAMIGASIVVTIGMVESEHFLDKQKKGHNKIGLTMSGLGWLLIATLVSINRKTRKFDLNLFFKRGLPALLVFAIGQVVHKMLQKGKSSILLSSGMFISSWALFSAMLVHTESTKKKERMALIYGGAGLINMAMIALYLNRRYNTLTGKWDGPQNVFSMGLPVYTLGWVSLSLGFSLC